ncbi:bifunctional phosphoribosyl-AMP cyclohydrolase/phosphoribosyl-ATP diphosphatase HisIE [Hyphobacterium sp. HN65]|uniref:Histidine biosynthesis bifunctional protein HisIE n=1 Tax=Hyphobacterium lacteum TaxID=3116575 RepID=A0ABU7LSD1_9PROT|nr:bifunctional phosphoribosyl-AMP cyclohydrolase/phosphoribosyl-ATP diphosphatase HisIE [Hyphobacterium sp. HN65]MEE2526825.1 bifunctional phosphoribosyl-AMP cyclohydrolase/phosphoribosyl-ATP diphosphatase HisIE [Hyphobacterium sp. HN65]
MTRDEIDQLDFSKGSGLVPAIIQDAQSRSVLMLGYMNREAAEQTLETGRVTFFSRSRQSLWVKGETSGNVLHLVSMTADCDRDCLRVEARPEGPVCHTGSPTCFGNNDPGIIRTLEALYDTREDAGTSYVARLKAAGTRKIAQKIGEEGVEVALALTGEDNEAVCSEAADLVFHLVMGLKARGLTFDDVLTELAERRRTSVETR